MEIGSPSYFTYLTAAMYWSLILCWSIIIVFYWREYRRLRSLSPMIGTLLVVIFIDGARTLVESVYFGTWYTARTQLIPGYLWNLLAEPQYIALPKALNLIAALIIIAFILRRWFSDMEAEVRRQRRTDELYAELKQAHAELQSAQQAQQELTGMIVHDMRTPLTNVISGLGTVALMDGAPPEVRRELLRGAQDGAERLLGMVNDLLDINRLESGEMPLTREEFAAADVMREAAGAVAALAAEKRLTLRVEPAPADLCPYADRETARRVLVNLLGNAVKFTPGGGEVRLTAEARDGMVEFAVADTGEGIPTEHRERVFDKFYQVTSHAAGRQMSSGLGLAFCRLAVEAHGGRIGVESDVGRGSRFWFTLPAGGKELMRATPNDGIIPSGV
jgi:signal transduction histidine kinase